VLPAKQFATEKAVMIYTLTPNPSLDRTFVVPHLKVGEYNRGHVTRLDPGGKGINVSRNLRELGEDSVIVGYFGGGTGRALVDSLRDQGFTVEALSVEGETRSNITLIESDSDRWTKLNEYGPEISDEMAKMLLNLARARTKEQDIWVLSGSLPPGLPADYYAQLITIIKARGGLVYLDSSGPPLKYGCQAAPYLVKANQVEAETVLGRELPTGESRRMALGDFLEMGISLAVISCSAEGALLGTVEETIVGRPPSVTVKNPVGAGDSMLAALVVAHLRGWGLDEAARWCIAAGTASAMQEGTSVVTPGQIESLLEQVEVQRFPAANED